MDCYSFFDNSTIASLIAVCTTLAGGTIIYRRQKKIDNEFEIKKELAQKILELQQSLKKIIFILKRNVNTFQEIQETKEMTQEEFYKGYIQEINDIAKEVCEATPLLMVSIHSRIHLYFEEDAEVMLHFDRLDQALNKYYKDLMNCDFDVRKGLNNQPMLSLEQINEYLQALIHAVREAKNFLD